MLAATFWVLAGLIALFLGVALWTALAWPKPRPRKFVADSPGEAVSVLIPARNEAENISDCLLSVQAQGPVVGEILVLDDGSTDGTGELVSRMAARDERIRLISGTQLPEGWSGKCWACQQLGEQAGGRWLLFLDADARLSAGALPAMLDTARQYGCTMVSSWPGLVMRGFWEQLLMPLLNFLTFTFYPAPLAYIRENDASLALAHGACMLLRNEQYRSLGGHRVVRSELFEDTRLARSWRAGGMRNCCVDGGRLVHVRMYQTLGQIWVGFEKNFFSAFKTQAGFFAFLVVHLVLFLAPFIMLSLAVLPVFGGSSLWAILACCGLVLLIRLVLSLRFRHPLWSILLHPVAEVLLAAIALNSWWRMVSGRGVRWKHRTYSRDRAATLKEVGK